jgi:DNA-binding transcriptional LysR family regulator
MLETSQLQTLIAVAKYNSFSRAAEELGVTQSAISQSIKNIEKKIQTSLFIRNGKHVLLTEEGEKIHSLAGEMLTKFDDILEDINSKKSSLRGKLRIGTLYGIGKSWLGQEVIDFCSEHQDINSTVMLDTAQNLLNAFDNNQLDVLVVPEFAVPHGNQAQILGQEKSVLVLPRNDAFNIGDEAKFEDIIQMPTILFEKNDGLYMKWMREYFGRTPRNINKKFIINSHGNMLNAVFKGLGVAVVPTHVLARSRFKDQVRVFNKKAEITMSELFFVNRKEMADHIKVNALKEHLLKGSTQIFQ